MPSMINQVEAAFGTSIANERRVCYLLSSWAVVQLALQTLVEVVSQIDRTLFEAFVKDKIVHLTKVMRHGILESGLDWYETPRPTGTV